MTSSGLLQIRESLTLRDIMLQLTKVLANRANDVITSRHDTVLNNLRIFFDFVNGEILLKSILEEVLVKAQDPEPIVKKMESQGTMTLPVDYQMIY